MRPYMIWLLLFPSAPFHQFPFSPCVVHTWCSCWSFKPPGAGPLCLPCSLGHSLPPILAWHVSMNEWHVIQVLSYVPVFFSETPFPTTLSKIAPVFPPLSSYQLFSPIILTSTWKAITLFFCFLVHRLSFPLKHTLFESRGVTCLVCYCSSFSILNRASFVAGLQVVMEWWVNKCQQHYRDI